MIVSDRARRQVTDWANDLLDMSRRNTSLYYRPLKRGTLKFVSPSPARIHELIAGSKPLSLYYPPPEDLLDVPWTLDESRREADPDQLVSDRTTRSEVEKTLRNLDSQAQADLLDRGLESLYVCFGMLRWKEVPDADVSSSPLIFVPIELKRESPRDPYRIQRSDGDAVLNPSLRVLLQQDFAISLPEHSAESPADEDLDLLFGRIRGLVSGNGWAVDPVVVLKRATFHKEAMYKDLLDNVEQAAGHAVVAALADPSAAPAEALSDVSTIPSEDEVDQVVPPENSHLILDADASQRRAIVAALRGSSLVMDGPPGTGKSQTISNLIAELIAGGRSVLFVSEKIAALDVVAKRLKGRGLGDFLLELHSHKISRREVAAELGRSLRRHPTAKPRFTSAEAQHYRKARVSLTEYAAAVNRVREPLGQSVHWVLGRLAQLAKLPAVEPPTSVTDELSGEDVAALTARFAQLSRVWEPAERADMFEWRGLEVADLSQAARTELIGTLDDLRARLMDVETRADALAYASGLRAPDDLSRAETLVAVCAFVRTQPVTEPTWWPRSDLHSVAARLDQLAADAHAQADDVDALRADYGERWAELDPTWSTVLATARSTLNELAPPAAPAPTATSDILVQRTDFLRSSCDIAHELASENEYLSHALGARYRERSVAGIRDLARVASTADAPRRPERRWAVPSVAMQVRQSIDVLTPLVEDYQQRHERLADHFEPGVYDLDLRGLVTRFRDVHRGWRKLGKVFRDDKRTVANVSRTKRADKQVRDLLADALELRQLAGRLDEQERQDRELLGRFYRPRASDLDAALGALEQLKLAADILGEEYNAQQVAAQLAGDAPADLDLAARAQRLLARLKDWRRAGEAVGFEPASLEALSPARLEQWATSAETATDAVHRVVVKATGLRRAQCDLAAVDVDTQRRADVDRRSAAMRAEGPRDAELLGCFADGFNTDTTAAVNGLRWVQELQSLEGGPVPGRAAAQLHNRVEPVDHEPLQDALDATSKLVDKILDRFEAARREELRLELSGKFAYATELVDELLSASGKIDVWDRFVTLTREMAAEGWSAPLDTCVAARLPSNQVVETFEKAMYVAWFDAVAAVDRTIGSARAADLDATVERFRSLDRELINDAAESVVASCNARRPTTTVGAASIIVREAEKKRKHMPVRDLLAKAGDVAQAIKPCFMMSPLSVSQFIPPDMPFDVVIFDEASQITPADAINCIYRGSQLVVAGDDNQLPPTSFFDRAHSDDSDVYDEDQFDDFESVLKLCKGAAGLPSVPLRWHYRSQHESLITFSNYQFYDGNLITYPGASTNGADLGVESFVVDGVYRRGGSRDNPIEAEYVVNRVFHHADAHPDRTVGVVTFNLAQMDMIRNLIEKRRAERPDLDDWFKTDRLDGFFVKNLESVQGDERDIMIFSIGYGPDEVGKLTLGFGPLSTSGGWRRLNVAITRARRRVEVVASFRPNQLNASGTRHRGVKELQSYLDYAERGVAALVIDRSQSAGDLESPLEESVYRTIRSWGYEVVPQVGTAGYRVDLGIRHPDRPGEFMLGVECDGRAYHSSLVARDRDRLRQEVLEGLGWRLHRIWGPSWYRDRDGQEQRLRAALEEAANGGGKPQVVRSVAIPAERQHEEVSFDQPPSWVEPYRVSEVRARTGLYPYEPAAFSETARVAREVLDVEAPIHIDFLARRVADAFDCNLTRKVRKAVADAVLTLSRQQKCRRDGDWVWVSAKCPIRVPGENEDARRDVEHIPHQELDGALYLLLRDARSATDEEVVTQIGRLFGVLRISTRARAVLEEAIVRLHEAGRVEWLEDGRLRPVDHGAIGSVR